MNNPLAILEEYFQLIQNFSVDPAAYATVLHPEVEQVEFPNMFFKTIQRRSFDDIITNVRAGRELLRDPSFEVQHTQFYPDGSVQIEGVWQATLTNDKLPVVRGQRVSAQLCLIFEFKDGKIYRQRRYPCFDTL
ncbi:nuclear transport factor 2 family protein [Hymenobacter sp. GOD-10R]|uniref:nuclear transport factor 2 family protein n=1 Tax=Hymenobacter sp. GOD-10R TaxID=3093922 RepID=UPI002D76EC22|nr:nuclear transport factor 2 family protein [Hymenobacter sp. GOD-10R]WRQ28766.1 nuclear transport factor 2 family protein [Hymenobacter sp. GOD-10R]